ncbi:hypothetical protein [Rufibacter sp. LB8]|uniref:hypothetical protein n=1 Tax=Rufibacter sp. LB8 TaxID=2777781 RepID=UPI00178C4404|nr:hypothetical protein [Rufibacter sp. LB8]
MKIVGNIQAITPNRSSKNKNVELHIDRVEYLTQKKDGRYYQDFDYIDDLDSPLVITGDFLALATDKKLPEGELAFKVYDLVEGEYVHNPQKYLAITLFYDFDENQTILSEVDYVITLDRETFEQLMAAREKEKGLYLKNRKKR